MMLKKRGLTLFLLACVLAALAGAGGALAYLKGTTGGAVNTFVMPGGPVPVIIEDFDGTEKRAVRMRNDGDIPAYARAELVITFEDDEGRTLGMVPEEGTDYELHMESAGWFGADDGFWYCREPVRPGCDAPVLVGSLKETGTAVPGRHLVCTVLGQMIQAAPAERVETAWGVRPGPDGSLSGGGN